MIRSLKLSVLSPYLQRGEGLEMDLMADYSP